MARSPRLKTYLLSDSWAWCWYPMTHVKGIPFEPLTSNRYGDLCHGSTPQGFPIMKILLEAQGHDATVLGHPGSSNRQQTKKLEKQIQHQRLLNERNPDLIVILQTDPLRDLGYGQDFWKKICEYQYPEEAMVEHFGIAEWTVEQFENTVTDLVRTFYNELFRLLIHNDLQNVPVLFLGGCGTVDSKLLSECCAETGFQNAHVVSENIICDVHRHITGEHVDPFHACCLNRIERLVDETWNPDLVNHLYNISYETTLSRHSHLNYYTFPDSSHSNATSMIVVVELINQYLDKLGL